MPVDITTEVGQVRYNIGDVFEPYMLEDNVIEFVLDRYPEDSSDIRVWKATIDCLRLLKSRFSMEGERRREREGGVEVELYTTKVLNNICDLILWFELNPPSSVKRGYDLHIFGGTSKKEINRVRNDPDVPCPNAYIGMTFEEERGYLISDLWKGYEV